MSVMVASELRCCVCGSAFYGRVDARYCCGACRQAAYRLRTRRRAADKTVPAPKPSRAVAQAQQTRKIARAARDRAKATRRASSATLAASSRPAH